MKKSDKSTLHELVFLLWFFLKKKKKTSRARVRFCAQTTGKPREKNRTQVSSLRPSSWGWGWGAARTCVAAANSYNHNHTNNTNKSTHQPIRRKASALLSQTLQVVPGLRRWTKKKKLYQHAVLNASESPECNNAVCGCRADNKHFREALSVSHPELFAAETLKTLSELLCLNLEQSQWQRRF